MPGRCRRRPVAGGVGAGGSVGLGPGGGPVQVQDRPVPGRAAGPGAGACLDRAQHHPVRAQPSGHHDRQVGQHVRQPGDVVPGVHHDLDRGIPGLLVPCGDQPFHHVPQLGGGDRGGVVVGSQADRVQHRGPARAPALQRRDERVGPARDHLRGALRPAVHMAEQPVRAGPGVRAQPRRDVRRQRDPPVYPRQRQPGHRPAQPGEVRPPGVQPVVQATVPAPVLRFQRQLGRRAYRSCRAQHRVRQFEQLIGPGPEAVVEVLPESGEQIFPVRRRVVLTRGCCPGQTGHHGHRHRHGICRGIPKRSGGDRTYSRRHAAQPPKEGQARPLRGPGRDEAPATPTVLRTRGGGQPEQADHRGPTRPEVKQQAECVLRRRPRQHLHHLARPRQARDRHRRPHRLTVPSGKAGYSPSMAKGRQARGVGTATQVARPRRSPTGHRRPVDPNPGPGLGPRAQDRPPERPYSPGDHSWWGPGRHPGDQ